MKVKDIFIYITHPYRCCRVRCRWNFTGVFQLPGSLVRRREYLLLIPWNSDIFKHFTVRLSWKCPSCKRDGKTHHLWHWRWHDWFLPSSHAHALNNKKNTLLSGAQSPDCFSYSYTIRSSCWDQVIMIKLLSLSVLLYCTHHQMLRQIVTAGSEVAQPSKEAHVELARAGVCVLQRRVPLLIQIALHPCWLLFVMSTVSIADTVQLLARATAQTGSGTVNADHFYPSPVCFWWD